jgi:AraC family transcriptional regulator
VACSSTFHFQRMFQMLTGVTVGDYMRKRRLTLAAQELATSDVRVIDIALKYGYDTPESFTKAFRKVHEVTPSAARKPETRLKVFPRLSFQLSIKGDKDMDYRIVEKQAFKVVGKAIRVSTRDNEHMQMIPKFWQSSMTDGVYQAVVNLNTGQGMFGGATMGVCVDFQMDKQEFTYMIAVESLGSAIPDGFVEKEIKAATWAVFDSVGALPDAIQSVWQRIFSEFFPSTGFEHAEGGAEIEIYPPGLPSDESYKCEVWIPIVRK